MNAPSPVDTRIDALSGTVHGGRSPITGATINFYATSSSATAIVASASMVGGYNGTPTLIATTTTNSTNGGFTVSGTCPAGQYAFIQAVGGNPGLSATPATSPINLVAALGPCSSLGGSTNITINELTTVAAAYALGGFESTSAFGFVTDSSNVNGLAHAFLNAANLVNPANAAIGANPATVTGTGIIPVAELNTLADILASCVNSDPASSNACSSLYSAATPPAVTGVAAPTNVWQAALDIARYPAANPAGLYALAANSPAFSPTLSAQPADWTVAITYGGLSGVQLLAIDGNDNVYVSENTSVFATPPATSTFNASVIELSSNGVKSSTNLVYNAGSSTLSLLTDPQSLVVDKNNTLWVANGGAALAPTSGTVYGPANSNVVFALPANNGTPSVVQTVGFDDPQALAVDSANNLWIGNGATSGTFGIYGMSEVTSAGTYTTFGTSGAGGKTAAGCTGMALDASNTVWCTTGSSYRVERFYAPYSSAPVALSLTNNDPKQIAIDASGNGWTALAYYKTYPASLTEVAAGTATTQTNYNALNGLAASGTQATWGIAIDGLGNIWYANETQNGVSEFAPFIGTTTTSGSSTAAGTALSESGGFTPGFANSSGNLLASPYSVAIDAAGSLWVTNYNGTSVVQILGPAAPTEPVQAYGKFGTLP